jgi:hypothetical protein
MAAGSMLPVGWLVAAVHGGIVDNMFEAILLKDLKIYGSSFSPTVSKLKRFRGN